MVLVLFVEPAQSSSLKEAILESGREAVLESHHANPLST